MTLILIFLPFPWVKTPEIFMSYKFSRKKVLFTGVHVVIKALEGHPKSNKNKTISLTYLKNVSSSSSTIKVTVIATHLFNTIKICLH